MKREQILAKKLAQLESEFPALLVECLEQCARGRWGLFSRSRWHLPWPEATRLREIAPEIHSIRTHFGEADAQSERFLTLCSATGDHFLGEPKLAAEFLTALHTASETHREDRL